MILGILAVVAACIGIAAASSIALRQGHWLALLVALGLAAFVAGVVGARSFPSEELVRQVGPAAAASRLPGPWDAGIRIPGLEIHLTPVAVGGLLLATAGLSLVLLFEPVEPLEGQRRPAPVLPPLEGDDAV